MAKKKKTSDKDFVVIVYKDDSLVSYCHKYEIDIESEDIELVAEASTEEEVKEAHRNYAIANDLKHQY